MVICEAVITYEIWLPPPMSPQSVPSQLFRRFTEEPPPYPVWSEKLVGVSDWSKTVLSVFRSEGDKGHLWAVSYSDKMGKDYWTKNGSKNAKKRHMHFIQMHDANEEDWETEIEMKEDGATKMSEDKPRVMMKPNTLGNPSGL
ncbi:hypothetical protein BS47DRAFT_1356268 [Hydnum rufescens UP504]|uniref:Uncharacterized protein n=1 Tax=Hydnum rufescens UP504 TaxID=1448309 RepID=A0A9P6AEE6_9AGAM|nr:hypothetical protein BS47DRAFT_1356268 [Hydnum rufescens UP504]